MPVPSYGAGLCSRVAEGSGLKVACLLVMGGAFVLTQHVAWPGGFPVLGLRGWWVGLCSSANKLEDDSEVMLPSISVHKIEQAPQMASANAYVPRMNLLPPG